MKNTFAIIIAVLALGTLFVILNDHTALFAKESKSGDHLKVTNQIDTIELQIDSSNTTIMPSSKNEVKAELEGKGTLTLIEKGDTIEVTVKRDWYEWISFNAKSDVKVYIPEKYNQNMKIDIGSGNLEFAGDSDSNRMELDELAIDMSSGNVELKNLDTNEFRHEGSSGKLTVDNLSTKDGNVDISSGDVSLTHYEGPLKGDLSSGRLNVEMDSLKGDVDIDISSGKVDLDLPDNASFTLDGESSSGKISCDFPLDHQESGNGDLSGVHGSGKYDVKVSVSSGNVKIY